MKHIDQMHKDRTLPTVRQNIEVNKKKVPCALCQQPQGCKRGQYCDFSHEQASPRGWAGGGHAGYVAGRGEQDGELGKSYCSHNSHLFQSLQGCKIFPQKLPG